MDFGSVAFIEMVNNDRNSKKMKYSIAPKCSVQTSKFLLMSESVQFIQIVTIIFKIIIIILHGINPCHAM